MGASGNSTELSTKSQQPPLFMNGYGVRRQQDRDREKLRSAVELEVAEVSQSESYTEDMDSDEETLKNINGSRNNINLNKENFDDRHTISSNKEIPRDNGARSTVANKSPTNDILKNQQNPIGNNYFQGQQQQQSQVALLQGGIDNRVPCNICGRKFAPDRLEKHMSVCSKTSRNPPRRKFDAMEMRTKGLATGEETTLIEKGLSEAKAVQDKIAQKEKEATKEKLRTRWKPTIDPTIEERFDNLMYADPNSVSFNRNKPNFISSYNPSDVNSQNGNSNGTTSNINSDVNGRDQNSNPTLKQKPLRNQASDFGNDVDGNDNNRNSEAGYNGGAVNMQRGENSNNNFNNENKYSPEEGEGGINRNEDERGINNSVQSVDHSGGSGRTTQASGGRNRDSKGESKRNSSEKHRERRGKSGENEENNRERNSNKRRTGKRKHITESLDSSIQSQSSYETSSSGYSSRSPSPAYLPSSSVKRSAQQSPSTSSTSSSSSRSQSPNYRTLTRGGSNLSRSGIQHRRTKDSGVEHKHHSRHRHRSTRGSSTSIKTNRDEQRQTGLSTTSSQAHRSRSRHHSSHSTTSTSRHRTSRTRENIYGEMYEQQPWRMTNPQDNVNNGNNMINDRFNHRGTIAQVMQQTDQMKYGYSSESRSLPPPVFAQPPQVTNFCTQCGNRFAPNALYCAVCGQRRLSYKDAGIPSLPYHTGSGGGMPGRGAKDGGGMGHDGYGNYY